jgi:hypothetical protein
VRLHLHLHLLLHLHLHLLAVARDPAAASLTSFRTIAGLMLALIASCDYYLARGTLTAHRARIVLVLEFAR